MVFSSVYTTQTASYLKVLYKVATHVASYVMKV